MAKIIINKEYFKNLDKGTHTVRVNFADGYAEGQFEVDDKIYFYISDSDQVQFTATKGQTWAEWIQSFSGSNTSGNGIIWVSAENELYIDPLYDAFEYADYSNYQTGSDFLRLIAIDTYQFQDLRTVIEPNTLYGCPVCCFDAGTKVYMADGSYKNIEEVTEGDEVLSYNEGTGQFEKDLVTRTIIKHNSDDLVYLKLSNGVQIGMRAYHPLLTADGWKSLRPSLVEAIKDINGPVGLLEIGDTLIGIEGNPTIEEIINREPVTNYDTYNLSIAGNHNYIANGVVAHNATTVCK